MSIKEFLRFATYDGLFENVALVNHPEIIEWLKQRDPFCQEVHIDDNFTAWPTEQWIIECKRKEKEDAAYQHAHNTYVAKPYVQLQETVVTQRVDKVKVKSKLDLRLEEAIRNNDYETIAKIKMIKAMFK